MKSADQEKLPVNIAITAQQADLIAWKRNLTPSAFQYLKQLVESKNEGVIDSDEIIRGQEIYELFSNKLLFKLYPETKHFHELASFHASAEGIVLLGVSDPQGWIDGVSKTLYEEGIAGSTNPFDQWSAANLFTTSGGRHDLLLFFKTPAAHDVAKMAMWRLRFGDCSWWSDYIINFTKDYN